MISLSIDNNDFVTQPNTSIIEACKHAGINIPRFCYHEILPVAGNCRMCLVEIENSEKPMASCVTEVEEGMSILTNSAFVRKARENVVETLLLNHPLDCPICDQAGECDLQDQAKAFGSTGSRYFYPKKPVEDKYCGPLIKTIMTRCISCTRCVRYSSDFAGEDFFGTLNRGGNTEIGAYKSNFFKSEISGNVIDLCPVGALTSYPNAFKARPWELRVAETIDTTDALGSKIYVNYKETDINRILPKNTLLNDNIISDKARFHYDANTINRVTDVFFFDKKLSIYIKQDWKRFSEYFQNVFAFNKLIFLINHKTDLKAVITLKKLKNLYPRKIQVLVANEKLDENNTQVFRKLNIIDDLKSKVLDSVLFLGSNPKTENPVINARLRNRVKDEIINIYSLGFNHEYNYSIKSIFSNSFNIFNFLKGKSKLFSKEISKSTHPLFIIGDSYKERVFNEKIFTNIIIKSFNNGLINFLDYNLNHTTIKFSGFKEINFNKQRNKKGFFFASELNENTLLTKVFNFFKKYHIIWNHTHGSVLSTKARVLLPSLSFFENEYMFFNIENKLQLTKKLINYGFKNKSFQNILNFLFSKKSKKNVVKKYFNEESKSLSNMKFDFFTSKFLSCVEKKRYLCSTKISSYPIIQKHKDYYTSDINGKNSLILNQCDNEVRLSYKNYVTKF